MQTYNLADFFARVAIAGFPTSRVFYERMVWSMTGRPGSAEVATLVSDREITSCRPSRIPESDQEVFLKHNKKVLDGISGITKNIFFFYLRVCERRNFVCSYGCVVGPAGVWGPA